MGKVRNSHLLTYQTGKMELAGDINFVESTNQFAYLTKRLANTLSKRLF
jgi:hypothetical protein